MKNIREVCHKILPYTKWVAATAGITGATLLALKLPFSGYAFIFYMVSSVVWVFSAAVMKERALLLECCIYSVINVLGMYRWLF